MPTEYCEDTTTCPACDRWVDLHFDAESGLMIPPEKCPHCGEPLRGRGTNRPLPAQ